MTQVWQVNSSVAGKIFLTIKLQCSF